MRLLGSGVREIFLVMCHKWCELAFSDASHTYEEKFLSYLTEHVQVLVELVTTVCLPIVVSSSVAGHLYDAKYLHPGWSGHRAVLSPPHHLGQT